MSVNTDCEHCAQSDEERHQAARPGPRAAVMAGPGHAHHHAHPGQCILQVLLVSPPPYNATDPVPAPAAPPFSPWRPGDAYSVESDLSDWRLLLGSVQDGQQIRCDDDNSFLPSLW